MEQKFKILTYQEFRDEHLNDTPEKMAYANYVDNVHAANILYSMQNLSMSSIESQKTFNNSVTDCLKGLHERDNALSKLNDMHQTALITHKAKIQFLDQVAWISVAIHFLTTLCIVLHLLKGSK
jgi:hypothetical protein